MAEEKLSKVQEMVVSMLKENLDKGYIWEQGWKPCPQMSIKGTVYSGINSFLLTLIAMTRGYTDNRWMTFTAMKKAGWSFKRDESGKCLGTGAGVPVEYFETYDKKTKRPFTRAVLEGMDTDEIKDYLKENVVTVRKNYTVFNCSLIKGVPEIKPVEKHDSVNERIEGFLKNWSEKEVEIIYGGEKACYSPRRDKIYLPAADNFVSYNEFYGTALHEVAHSTGAKSRLDRKDGMKGAYGDDNYANEELVAEIASLFISQEFGTEITESQVKNSAAYIDDWKKAIKEDANTLIKAVGEAVKIDKYIVGKEKEFEGVSSGEVAA